jgi:hypothetical protein
MTVRSAQTSRARRTPRLRDHEVTSRPRHPLPVKTRAAGLAGLEADPDAKQVDADASAATRRRRRAGLCSRGGRRRLGRPRAGLRFTHHRTGPRGCGHGVVRDRHDRRRRPGGAVRSCGGLSAAGSAGRLRGSGCRCRRGERARCRASAAGRAMLLRNYRDDHGSGSHRSDGASGCHQRDRVESEPPRDRADAGPRQGEHAEQRDGEQRPLVRRPGRPQSHPDCGPLARRSQQGRHHDVGIAAWAPAHDRTETRR